MPNLVICEGMCSTECPFEFDVFYMPPLFLFVTQVCAKAAVLL